MASLAREEACGFGGVGGRGLMQKQGRPMYEIWRGRGTDEMAQPNSPKLPLPFPSPPPPSPFQTRSSPVLLGPAATSFWQSQDHHCLEARGEATVGRGTGSRGGRHRHGGGSQGGQEQGSKGQGSGSTPPAAAVAEAYFKMTFH